MSLQVCLPPTGLARFLQRARQAALAALLAPCIAGPASGQQASEPAAVRDTSQSIRFFISGHSLSDNPLAEYLSAVSASGGYRTSWNQQINIGAPIVGRTRGDYNNPVWWLGYKSGKNNGRHDMDVVAELKANPYDFLIIVEGHHTVKTLRWNDTVRYLRHFHERLVDGNPKATTYFYEPWEGIKDMSNPRPWVALEREATKIWGCVPTRINRSLEHEGRSDRVKSLPIAAGLADLVDRVTTQEVKGISGPNIAATMKRLFSDDVHITRFGYYYVALLNYIGITGRKPDGVWKPDFMSPEVAATLQEIAWSFYEKRKAEYRPLTLPQCIKFMTDSFCDAWNKQVPNQWAPPINDCKDFFGRQTATLDRFDVQNPFVFDAATEGKYWFPPP
jgi:hypothetical protein